MDEEPEEEGEYGMSKKPRVEEGGGKGEPTMTEYERQRARRIKQNEERMKALNLPTVASSLKKEFVEKKKGKSEASGINTKDRDDEEEDYQPTSEEEDDEDDDDYNDNRGKKQKGKAMRTPKKMKVGTCQQSVGDFELGDVDADENAALQRAISLSLEGVGDPSNITGTSDHHASSKVKELEARPSARKKVQRGTSRTKGRTTKNISRPKMSEDDVIGHFFSIDAIGKGSITSWDLKKAMKVHDFNWSEKEIEDMIRPFDSDGDGKLTLEEFRRVVAKIHLENVYA